MNFKVNFFRFFILSKYFFSFFVHVMISIFVYGMNLFSIYVTRCKIICLHCLTAKRLKKNWICPQLYCTWQCIAQVEIIEFILILLICFFKLKEKNIYFLTLICTELCVRRIDTCKSYDNNLIYENAFNSNQISSNIWTSSNLT